VTIRSTAPIVMIIILMVLLFVTLAVPAVSHAQPMGRGMYRGAPYGHYCPGKQWGPYGVRKPVTTADQAKQVIEFYLTCNKNQGLSVGSIEEKKWYFEAEILDQDKKITDKVIVDKRSGRIRSIY
jgi:hypothetical protein